MKTVHQISRHLLTRNFGMQALKVSRVSFLFLQILLTPHLFAQWEMQQSNVSVQLSDVHFVAENRGWVVGSGGTILSTSNGGVSWQIQTSGVTQYLQRVFFVDSLFGWAGGIYSPVIRTTDGGITWNSVKGFPNGPIADVYFINRSIGWAIGGWSSYGFIYGTTDGGTTWNSLIDSTVGIYQDVHFLNEMEGWVVGGEGFFDNFDPDIILHTTDGGAHWEEQFTPTSGPLLRVNIVNQKIGWAGGTSVNGGILKTTDGGITWESKYDQQGPLVSGYPISGISAPDSSIVWVVRHEEVNYSSDGGETWARMDPEDSSSAVGIFFLNPNVGWLVGTNGSIWKYNNAIVFAAGSQSAPEKFSLYQNYPNPFNPSTTISFDLPREFRVRLVVYDIYGREIRLLLNEVKQAGAHQIQFEERALPSGVYFYRLEAGSYSAARPMVLLK